MSIVVPLILLYLEHRLGFCLRIAWQ